MNWFSIEVKLKIASQYLNDSSEFKLSNDNLLPLQYILFKKVYGKTLQKRRTKITQFVTFQIILQK